MMSFNLDLGTLNAHLAEAERRADHMRDPIEEIGEAALRQNERTFDSEGPGWKRADYRTKPAGTPTGVKTGRLKASYTRRNSEGNHFVVNETSGEFGSDVAYAEDFQRGQLLKTAIQTRRSGPGFRESIIPARPVVEEPDSQMLSEIDRSMVNHFDFQVGQ